jgi:hypothetical protein
MAKAARVNSTPRRTASSSQNHRQNLLLIGRGKAMSR